MTYNKLLEFAGPRIRQFLKDKQCEGAFGWTDFNAECYKKMYEENSYDDVRTVKMLKEEIPELREVCKRCGQFYVRPRNKSVVVYDLMFGKLLEDVIIDFLNAEFRIHAVHGDITDKRYPDCMILGPDKGIVAYFEVKYHGAPFINAIHKINRYCYEGSATLDFKKVVRQLEIIDSDIERPVFYLHWIDYPCLKGIFFETSEQVKDYIYGNGEMFVRQKREGDEAKTPQSVYLEKIYSPLLTMGTFDEFINMIRNMRG